MAGGSKMYWEMSCPNCGKPSNNSPDTAQNKVNPNCKGKVPSKVKCVRCGTKLFESNRE